MALSPEQPECPICLQSMDPPTSIALRCNHVFHADCAWAWAGQQPNCAYCREPIEPARHLHLQLLHMLRDRTSSRGPVWDSVANTDRIVCTTSTTPPSVYLYQVHMTAPPKRPWWRRWLRCRTVAPMAPAFITQQVVTVIDMGVDGPWSSARVHADCKQRHASGDGRAVAYTRGPVVDHFERDSCLDGGNLYHFQIPERN